MNRLAKLAGFLLLTLVPCRAEVRPASVFSSHMVLQRDAKVPVWGTAGPGEEVTVEFAGQRRATKTGADGKWCVELEPMPADATGRLMVISSGSKMAQFDDVLVGEVWLCSGQSNMAWTVRENGVSVANAADEVAAANYPLIRQLRIPRRNTKEPVDSFDAEWTVCSPQTAGSFSGVGYFFARALFQKLNVPIGIINSSYGGTPIEAWMSGETFAMDPACAAARARFAETTANWPQILTAYRAGTEAWTREAADAKAAGAPFDKPKPRQPVGLGHPYSPVTVYNAMLRPLIPCAIRGVAWYQGESNTPHAEEYAGLFAALIRQWRAEWGRGDFPFYFVQIANYKGAGTSDTGWPWLREAQAKTLALPNTGMAVTIDIGNPNDIHPRNKQDVGRRLALLALAKTYGEPGGEFSGPVFVGSRRAGDAIEIAFEHAEGLMLKNPATGFEIAGADRVWVSADARMQDGKLVVHAPGVKEPAAVRYAWSNAPEASLFNAAGLPAAPFRTDDWPPAP